MKSYISRILTLLVLLTASLIPGYAFEGQWKLHPTFDDKIGRLLVTPDRVYMLALAQPYEPAYAECPAPQGFLYVYDKKAEELSVYDKSTGLSGSVISSIEYNAKRGYLLIIYDDLNIDLLFDNGNVVNIPALKMTSLPSSKKVNSVTFDPSKGHAYLATDFGFIVLNDKKGEVYESRIYNQPIKAVARMKDRLVAVDAEGKLHWAPATSPNFSFSDFTPVELTSGELEEVLFIFPIADTILGVVSNAPEGEESPMAYSRLLLDTEDYTGLPEDTFSAHLMATGEYVNVSTYSDGHFLWGPRSFGQISNSGGYTRFEIPSEARSKINGASSPNELWEARGRIGLRSWSRKDDWTVTRDYMIPDVSSVFISQDMAYHPTYGLLVSNHGNETYFESVYYLRPILLSALKDGRWIRHGLNYTNPPFGNMMFNPAGLAIDPKNMDHVYFGSALSGIGRISLKDPKDVLHMGSANDYSAKLPGFIEMLPVLEAWDRSARMSAPRFDRDGNLWSIYNNLDNKEYPSELWVWPRANIDATKDAKTFKPWLKIPIKSNFFSTASIALPTTSAGNTTKVFVSPGSYGMGLIMIDHKGTLANTGDDVQIKSENLYDQDGQPTGFNYIHVLYEDPTTGLIWVGTDVGLFTVNPSTFAENPSLVNRVKVSRDDGTSLADYLLNGVDISCIIDDPYGRKWFGTIGGGLVCTSSDGRQVKGEWTTENSMLPDNNVYGLGWNPETGSLMVSTGKGLAEFYPAGEGTGKDFDSLRVFPNPVGPDYQGWVTIDGLTDGALVKITDAHGNLVRELGRVVGGTIQWDAANLNGRRVPSGVYYILASGGDSDSGLARVGKVLVVN